MLNKYQIFIFSELTSGRQIENTLVFEMININISMSRICRIRHTKCNIHMGWSQQLLYIHKISKSFLDKKILLTGYIAFFTAAKYTVLWFEVLRWRYSRSHINILYFFTPEYRDNASCTIYNSNTIPAKSVRNS